jgi:hypothetical protein
MTERVLKETESMASKELVMVILSVLIPLTALVAFNFWEEGYLGSYWERWERPGDIKCYDQHGRLTSSSQETCFVLTLRGIKARERLTEACKAKGGIAGRCLQGAVDELTSHL